MNDLVKPTALKIGDTIGIISPASPQRDPTRLERGIAYLQSKGFNVILGESALKSYGGYFAGTDDERIADIEHMFANPEIDAIFCARGGYGTARLLNKLNYNIIAEHPKIFVGFSDTTALQCAILSKTGLVTFSGAMPSVDLADTIDPFTESSLWNVVMNHQIQEQFTANSKLVSFVDGYAEGHLICGNLCVMASLCGTDFLPDFHDSILLIEDIGEEEYRVDRLLSQLENCGILSSIKGLLFGDFTPPTNPIESVPHRSYDDIMKDYAQRSNKPCMAYIDYGHIARKLTLPMGIKISMNANTRVITCLESATTTKY